MTNFKKAAPQIFEGLHPAGHVACTKRIQDNQGMPKASNHEEVIAQALDALERAMFWKGFDREAEAYLNKHPRELAERNTFGQVSGDRMRPEQ